MDRRYESQVAFDESDAGGIVFFANYFKYAHRALENLLPVLGISWKEWFANEAFGVPLRHVEADYQHSLRPGERFSVSLKVLNVGHSSVQFEFEVLNSDGQRCAIVKTTHVFVALDTRAKMDIPPHIRALLEEG